MKGQPKQALVHESIETSEIWHISLAHVHYRALLIASKAVSVLSEIQTKREGICKGCAQGKNTVPSSERKSKGIRVAFVHGEVLICQKERQ